MVKLFNAVRIQQKTTEHAVAEVQEHRKASSALEKAKNGKTLANSEANEMILTGCLF